MYEVLEGCSHLSAPSRLRHCGARWHASSTPGTCRQPARVEPMSSRIACTLTNTFLKGRTLAGNCVKYPMGPAAEVSVHCQGFKFVVK